MAMHVLTTLLTMTWEIRRCDSFHLIRSINCQYNWYQASQYQKQPSCTNFVAVGMSTKSMSTETSPKSNDVTTTKRRKPSTSKFAGLMAGTLSSPSNGFEPLMWHDEHDSIRRTAVLPDDELPPSDDKTNNNNNIEAPSLHNKRTLYFHSSLLTKNEVSTLQNAAEQSGKFQEFDSRCAVIVEDGIYQSDDIIESSSNEKSGSGASSLASILHPILIAKIIPWARELSSNPKLTVADALIRSYDPSEERQDLSSHYDISTFATVIVPLNDPNEYEGGLYVQTGASANTRFGVPFTNAGDAVLHKYDVMHGVNVRSGKKRCSLVIWFGENEESVISKTVPWVVREAESGMSVHAAFLSANNSQNGLYGFTKDMEIAKQYYYWASHRGHALSAYNLSIILLKESYNASSEEEEGRIQSESVTLLTMAAERGLASAQNELGITYKQGYCGVGRDVEVARCWLTMAAEQGYGLSKDILDDPSRWID